MKEKYIQMLNKQIEKLSSSDFDLDAWKSSTTYLLTRIFGPADPKITEINNLKIDYSSWALRDSNAKYKPIETCKRKGKEILEIAKDEVELFGVEDISEKFANKLKELLDEKDYELYISPNSSLATKTDVLKTINKDKLIDLIASSL